MGINLAVVSLAGAAVACHPSRHHACSSRDRSRSHRRGYPASSGLDCASTLRRRSRMRATCKHSGSSGCSSRGKVIRAGATSRMTFPCVSVLSGSKEPILENEDRSRYWLVCKIVTTIRPSACNRARNSVAMPSRSTIIRATWLVCTCCS